MTSCFWGASARNELTREQIKPWARSLGRGDTKCTRLESAPTADADPVVAKILSLITDLGNTVLVKRAAAELHAYVQAEDVAQVE